MNATRPFFARHLFRIHAATYIAVLALFLLEGYFLNLPHPFSVPFIVYIILVALPFIIIPSFRTPAIDTSLPASLQKIIRFSPWCLAALWTSTLVILIMCIVGDVREKNILNGANSIPAKMEVAQRTQAQSDKQAFLDGVEQSARDEIRQGAPEPAVIDETVILFRQKGATDSEIDAVKKRLSTSANEKK